MTSATLWNRQGFQRETAGVRITNPTQTSSYSVKAVVDPDGFREGRLGARWQHTPITAEAQLALNPDGLQGGGASLAYAVIDPLTIGGSFELREGAWQALAKAQYQGSALSVNGRVLLGENGDSSGSKASLQHIRLDLGWAADPIDVSSETTFHQDRSVDGRLSLELGLAQLKLSGSVTAALEPSGGNEDRSSPEAITSAQTSEAPPPYRLELESFQVGIQVDLPPPDALSSTTERRQSPAAQIMGAPSVHVPTGRSLTLNGVGSYDPDGRVVQYQWDFGDGAQAEGRVVQHRYRLPGRYPVTLTVRDDDGLTSDKTIRVMVTEAETTISPNEAPVADPGGPYRGIAGQSIRFDGRGSHDPDGSITRFEWEFGDGTSGTGPTVSQTYQEPGRYEVTLTVEDDRGQRSQATATVEVSPRPQDPEPPDADFAFQPSAPTTQDEVQFEDRSSDPDGSIESWHWTFGDGSGSFLQNPSYRYAEAGTYRVELTVADADGLRDSAVKELTVERAGPSNRPPQADFSWQPVEGDQPTILAPIQFEDRSDDPDGQIEAWQWDFGDGSTSGDRNPTQQYETKGQFTVTLTVRDDQGATSSTQQIITIANLAPVADPNGPYEGFVGTEIVVDGSDSRDPDGQIAQFRWSFGDGATAQGSEATHSYDEPGEYDVCLIAVDDSGARSQSCTQALISLQPSARPTLELAMPRISP